MDIVELLIGFAEIAIAMAGFSGVVVAFGSRSQGAWHPGDRLRLAFLLEASLTAAGFSLLALLFLSAIGDTALTWCLLSILWFVFTAFSLWYSRTRIRSSLTEHDDVDQVANRVTTSLFVAMMVLQIMNVVVWQQIPAFLAAVVLNLCGAAMQFSRLIRSAFRS